MTAPEGPSAEEPLIDAWNRKVEWWLTGLAALFLVVYTWSVLDRSIGAAGRDGIEVGSHGRMGGLRDRLSRADRARAAQVAVRRDPSARPRRAAAADAAAPAVLRLITVIGVLNRQLRTDVRGRVVCYVAGTVTLVGFVAAVAVYDAERDARTRRSRRSATRCGG